MGPLLLSCRVQCLLGFGGDNQATPADVQDRMQDEERGALFVFEPDRERQCLAIGSNCKRVASHLTRPHWSHSPSTWQKHSLTHTLAHTLDANQGSGLAFLDPPAGACPWPYALPRDPCSKQVRSNGPADAAPH